MISRKTDNDWLTKSIEGCVVFVLVVLQFCMCDGN